MSNRALFVLVIIVILVLGVVSSLVLALNGQQDLAEKGMAATGGAFMLWVIFGGMTLDP